MEQFFQVGIITTTHGLRGEVKVYPTTDDVRRFRRLKNVLADVRKARNPSFSGDTENTPFRPEDAVTLEIEGVKFFKQTAILKFKGIDSVEEAEKYRKCSLHIPRSEAVRLGKDEYFIADLIGLAVRDEDGTEIGILKDVMETGANDVYVISLNDGKELLLPAIKQCVPELNVEAGYVRIHILDGLL